MTLKALQPSQSEQETVPDILESETGDIECDTTNTSPPPQAETVERDAGSAMTVNPVSNPATVYRYSPLPANSIRLLRLLPHSDEHALVHCQLFEYPLLDSSRGTHLYEALSYVWGSEEKPRRVLTNKGDLYITENLHAALLRLRDRSFERIIWVDAICINQDDIEERNHQVQAMASIYAKASRVIVWLEQAMGSHPRDGKASDDVHRALEEISNAASGQPVKSSDDKAIRLAIQTLLQRSWFERIWVLQEVAAARQVLMMFHSMDMDGFAFCTGLTALNHDFKDPDTQNRIRSAAYLIKGAGLRPKHLATFSDRFSLDICPLGELVDMYHTRKAKDLRDKIYALLGMSSDTLSGLLPNYNMLWRDLFRQLVHSLIGEQALVNTWDDQQVAVIKHTGCVLGKVLSVSNAGAWDERQSIDVSIAIDDGSEDLWRWDGCWTLQATAKSIQQGDVICLLQGASKLTIIRPCEDYCVVVAIAVTPIGYKRLEGTPFDWLDCSRRIQAFPREMLLVWDWETPCEELCEIDYECFLHSREFMHTKIHKETDNRWGKAARLHYVGWLLKDAESYEDAVENFQKAIKAYKRMYKLRHQANEATFEVWSQTYETINEITRPPSLSGRWETLFLGRKAEGLGIMADILGRRGDYSGVTEHGVIRIMRPFREELLKLLLAVHGDQVPITDEVMKTAAGDESSATEVVRLFLDWRGDQVPISEEVLKTAAKNPHQGREVLELLLSRRGDQISISEGIVESAAENYGQGREVIKLFLDRRGDQVPITEEMLKIAACNHYHGKQVIELLLSRRGNQVPVTVEVLKQAARNRYQAKEIIELLLDQRGDQVPITEEVLKVAAENIKQGKEVIDLLLDRCKGQILITEEVMKTATETWGRDGAIVRQLRYHYKI